LLIKCQECGREVSDSAASCPGCGSPIKRADATGRGASGNSTSAGCLAGCATLIVIIAILVSLSQCSQFGGSSEAPNPAASSTPSKAEAADTFRTKMGAIAVASLKNALRDPDSLVVESVLVSDDGKYSCLTYRAKNGFGGMNRDTVVFTVAGGDESSRGWNRHCAGKQLNDVTRIATMLAARVSR
jgi:hypothetical protein